MVFLDSVARARRLAEKPEAEEEASSATVILPAAERRRLRRAWAQMIRRIHEVDPLTCTCGAKMRILAFILDPQVVTKILRHVAARDTAILPADPYGERSPCDSGRIRLGQRPRIAATSGAGPTPLKGLLCRPRNQRCRCGTLERRSPRSAEGTSSGRPETDSADREPEG